jgi:hypothetical protein
MTLHYFWAGIKIVTTKVKTTIGLPSTYRKLTLIKLFLLFK